MTGESRNLNQGMGVCGLQVCNPHQSGGDIVDREDRVDKFPAG